MLVAEVSSFQLALTRRVPPARVGAAQHHARPRDWHGRIEAYVADKAQDLRATRARGTPRSSTSTTRVRRPSPIVAEQRASRPCASASPPVHAGWRDLSTASSVCETPGGLMRLVRPDELRILGAHNVEQRACGGRRGARGRRARRRASERACARSDRSSTGSSRSGDVDGVEYFNDSKATNPDAVLKALAAFPTAADRAARRAQQGQRPPSRSPRRSLSAPGWRCCSARRAGEFETAFEGLDVDVARAPRAGRRRRCRGARLAEPGDVVAAVTRRARRSTSSPTTSSAAVVQAHSCRELARAAEGS